MVKEKGRIVAKTLLLGFLVTLTIFMVAGCFIMLKEVISTRWTIIVISLILSAGLSLPMYKLWNWLTDIRNPIVCTLFNIIFMLPLFILVILIINQTNSTPVATEKAIVEKLYTQTRHRTRRVGRRSYAQGTPYKVYFMDIHLESGKDRSIEIQKTIYSNLSKGDTIDLTVKHGALGITTFDSRHLAVPIKKRKEHRKKESDIEKIHRRYQEHIQEVMHRTNSTKSQNNER